MKSDLEQIHPFYERIKLRKKIKLYIKAISEFSYRLIGKRPASELGRRRLIGTYMDYTGYTEQESNERLINALMELGFTKEEAKERLDRETSSCTMIGILVEVGFTQDKAKRITRIH